MLERYINKLQIDKQVSIDKYYKMLMKKTLLFYIFVLYFRFNIRGTLRRSWRLIPCLETVPWCRAVLRFWKSVSPTLFTVNVAAPKFQITRSFNSKEKKYCFAFRSVVFKWLRNNSRIKQDTMTPSLKPIYVLVFILPHKRTVALVSIFIISDRDTMYMF